MRKLTALMAAGLVLGASGMAMAATTASSDATATVVSPLAIAKDSGKDLKFGKISASGTAGTVVVTAADARTSTNVQLLDNSGGSQAAAVFTVTGETDAVYSVTLPTLNSINPVTLTGPSSATMTADTFTKSAASGTLSLGTDALKVGATLNVGSTQASGTYTGSFDVIVAYN